MPALPGNARLPRDECAVWMKSERARSRSRRRAVARKKKPVGKMPTSPSRLEAGTTKKN